jgi:tryptophanyl-tRNA synthetase
VLRELKPIQERAQEYTEQPELVRSIILEGSGKARDVAKDTLEEVKAAMNINLF